MFKKQSFVWLPFSTILPLEISSVLEFRFTQNSKMKLFYSAIAFGLFLVSPFLYGQQVLTGNQAKSLIPNTDLVRTSAYGKIPSFIKYEAGAQPNTLEYISNIEKNLKLSANMGLRLISETTDDLGFTHFKFQETFNGIDLESTAWIVHSKNGTVHSQNGFIHRSITSSQNASITAEQSVQYAMNHVNASAYRWENPAEEALIKREQDNEQATFKPQPTLVFVSKTDAYTESDFSLAYKMNIYASQPLSRQWVFVDAQNGAVIKTIDQLHHTDAQGTANTGYSGTRSITTDSVNATSFRLRETGRGNGVQTFNMLRTTNYSSAVDFTDTDNSWNNVNTQLDQYATDAHWGAEMTYDYYLNQHNRNSIDGAGFRLISYVHYDNGYNNAFWDGQRMTYGDGADAPLTSLDIAGHEITHGLTSNSANLDYLNESGALNESFSDIFGTAIESYARPNNWNWTVGEDLGSAFRSLSNPNAMGDPDTYFGNNWAPLNGADNGGVHTNSSVQNHWFYLLSAGGTGTNDNNDFYNVTGIGISDAAKIAFRNLTVYLVPTSNFADARFYSILAAIDLYGACTTNVASVTNAWRAVGVGAAYQNSVTSNFSSDFQTSCTAPLTVNFINNASNGQSFVWNFGDGTTSTDRIPVHTYTTAGAYNVSLSVNGGTCGNSTTIDTNYILISDTLPCIIIMPKSGVASTQTACSGKLFDSGGSLNNYGDNEYSTITIAPIGADSVTLSFLSFDIEPGSGNSCDYDYLSIYDGPSTNSALIGKYCNNNVPSTIGSTNGYITIEFYSDGGSTNSGFEIDWNCTPSTTAPVAGFSNDLNTTCSEAVQFTDLSLNGPTSWSWSFGDGQTSTLRNPLHKFASSGTFTVSLTATNAFGTDVATKTSLVVVNYSGSVTATSTTVCQGLSDTLIATAGGNNLWYADAHSNQYLFVGDTFITPPLMVSTPYYVEQETNTVSVYGGPADNSIGGGNSFNGDQSLIFDVTSPMVLEQVDVYAGNAGVRIIELRNSTGTILDTVSVNLPAGKSTIDLNFVIPTGIDYQLGVELNSRPGLFRNSNGGVYPYNVGGKASITGTTASAAGYYYFFYNWKVKDIPCTSPRVEVIATIDICTSVAELANNFNVSLFPNPASKEFTIQLPELNAAQTANLMIVNSLGQLVKQTSISNRNYTVNSSKWAKGIYLVHISIGNETVTKRMVIK